MKKIFISLLVGAMAATLTGCVNNGVEHDSPGTSTSNSSTSNTSTGGSSSVFGSAPTSDSDSAPFLDDSGSASDLSSVNDSSASTSDS